MIEPLRWRSGLDRSYRSRKVGCSNPIQFRSLKMHYKDKKYVIHLNFDGKLKQILEIDEILLII